jgi:Cu/Ag efflux protein CusF
MRRLKTSVTLAAGILISVLAGCEAKPEEKHYPIHAEVIAVELPKKLITVKHGDIPELMPAMTMSYVIAIPKEAESLAPGDKITADLVVSNYKARIEKIVLLEKAKPNSTPAPSAQSSQ